MKISVLLEALTGTFETDVARARKTLSKEFRQMHKAANDAAKVIGGALAVGVGAAGLAIKSAVDHMDELNKTSQKLGITTEALSAIEYAAKLSDVGLGELQAGLVKLVKTQAAAAKGGEDQIAVFEALGVAYKDNNGQLRDADAVFADVADRFAKMEDGAKKTALAVSLFGRAGADLIPLLNSGAEGLAAATKEAEQFGIIVDTEAAKAAEELNDNLTRMGTAVQGAGIQLATELLPALTDVSNQVVDMAKDPAFRSDLAEAIKRIAEIAVAAARGIVNLTNALGFLYDEAKQFIGLADDDDLVRLNEQLETAIATRERMQKVFENTGSRSGSGEAAGLAQAQDEVTRLEVAIAAAEAKVRARNLSDQIGPIDVTARRRPVDTTGDPFTDRAGAKEAARAAARAAREAAKEAEQLAKEVADAQADALRNYQGLKLETMTAEQRAVEELKAKYLELDEAVKLGAVSAVEASRVKANLATQAKDAQEQANKDSVEVLYEGLLTEEELIANSYDKRHAEIMQSAMLTEQQKQDAIRRLDAKFQEDMAAAAGETGGTMSEFAKEAAANMQDAFAQFLFDPFDGGLKGMLSGFVDMLRRMAAEAIAAKIFEKIAAGASGPWSEAGGIGSLFSAFAGAKDAGGTIPPGKWGLVGERRPELIAGPASVIGGAQTAAMMASVRGGSETRIRNIVVFSENELVNMLGSSPGMEKITVTNVTRNRRALGLA